MPEASRMQRSTDQRYAWQVQRLQALAGPDVTIKDLADVRQLPVLRKGDVLQSQRQAPPFGDIKPVGYANIFQSPGPIYEPGFAHEDPWRFGRFLAAMGVDSSDVVLNTFSYHFSPAGAMFETAARAAGAVVFPAGPGNSTQQAEVAADIKASVYAGTPDFLQVILAKAEEHGHDMGAMKYAAVSAGPLFPALRKAYEDRGILCRQCYGTADVGMIAYETATCTDGMYIDEDVLLEIVSPGTGEPLPDGEVGEVVVSVLSDIHPVLRFSVGDLSAIMPADDTGLRRIVGWRGRADQATKVRGVFIRPEQVSDLVKRNDAIDRARVEVSTGDDMTDRIVIKLETGQTDVEPFMPLVRDTLKLNVQVSLVTQGELPRDGVLVADLRSVP